MSTIDTKHLLFSVVQAVLSHNSNAALRNLFGVWVAPPAVAMLAFNSLENSDAIGPMHRALFCEYLL